MSKEINCVEHEYMNNIELVTALKFSKTARNLVSKPDKSSGIFFLFLISRETKSHRSEGDNGLLTTPFVAKGLKFLFHPIIGS